MSLLGTTTVLPNTGGDIGLPVKVRGLSVVSPNGGGVL